VPGVQRRSLDSYAKHEQERGDFEKKMPCDALSALTAGLVTAPRKLKNTQRYALT